jgi:hypothetical protein
MEEAVVAAKSALPDGILDQIQSATVQLDNASHKLAEVLCFSAYSSKKNFVFCHRPFSLGSV